MDGYNRALGYIMLYLTSPSARQILVSFMTTFIKLSEEHIVGVSLLTVTVTTKGSRTYNSPLKRTL